MSSSTSLTIFGSAPPPYGKRHLSNWAPRSTADFQDGGAYPEILIKQYPLNMGGSHSSSDTNGNSQSQGPGTTNNTLALRVQQGSESTGNVAKLNYDAVAKQGLSANKLAVYTDAYSMKEKWSKPEQLERPEQDIDDINTNRTANALGSILAKKMGNRGSTANTLSLAAGQGSTGSSTQSALALNNNQASNSSTNAVAPQSQFVRYTPSPDAPGFNPNAAQRVIKIVTKQIDPLQPPKFKHKKVPRGQGTPPPPRHQSPDRKLTASDQAAWVIPPCVSNWKNAKGYIIPLDKRIAADGRNLQDNAGGSSGGISDRHAEMAESLYHAETKAREELKIRKNLQYQRKVEEAARAETELKEEAKRAREAALAIRREEAQKIEQQNQSNIEGGNGINNGSSSEAVNTAVTLPASDRRRQDLSNEDEESIRYREEILKEKRKEVERQFRMERAGGMNNKRIKDDKDRDISEKIALGLSVAAPSSSSGGPGGFGTSELQYDSRLMNQTSGMDSGFGGGDESYNIYDKPLFMEKNSGSDGGVNGAAGSSNYHSYNKERQEEVTRGMTVNRGVEKDIDNKYGVTVQFERDEGDTLGNEDNDVFGVGQMTKRVKRG